tara:strand:- start:846 stop:1517 length:672 start_codon:yes stop_codon:yes gene_type:complete
MNNIIIILDESSSMKIMNEEPVDSINTFVKEQNNLEKKITLWKFNNRVKKVWDAIPINQVENFQDYQPRGMTALYDTIGMAINDKKFTKDTICLIITDGFENSSQKYTHKMIKNEIKNMEQVNKWSFLYFGASAQIIKEGINLGLKQDNCTNFTQGNLVKLMHSLSEDINASDAPVNISLKKYNSYPNNYFEQEEELPLFPELIKTQPLAKPPQLRRQNTEIC